MACPCPKHPFGCYNHPTGCGCQVASTKPDVAERQMEFNSDMEKAKKVKGDVLVWWPIVKLDDDGEMTTQVERGRWIVSHYNGNGWDEPDYLDAMGSFFGDDACWASEPTHWLPTPPPIKNKMAEAALIAFEAARTQPEKR